MAVASGNWRIWPIGEICPIAWMGVNQRVPSGPFVMLEGGLSEEGSKNSLILPAGVMRPTLPVPLSLCSAVNQRLPSGPLVMSIETVPGGNGNWLILPAGVMRPIWRSEVNQTAPSDPVVIPVGCPLFAGSGNSRIVPLSV